MQRKNHSILRLVKWFCRQLSFNELCSAISILHEVLCDQHSDIDLKPDDRPPHFRQFKDALTHPLTIPPDPKARPSRMNWREWHFRPSELNVARPSE